MARSTLKGVLGEIAELYRAFWPTITPPELDKYELWQIAVIMGLDEAKGFTMPSGRPLPPQPPPEQRVTSDAAAPRRLRAVI